MMPEPKTFDELVSFVTWMIIDSITRGSPLRGTIHQALSYVLQWKPEQPKN